MSKLTRAQIYKKVVDALRGTAHNINGLATETGIRWETVEKTLESLEESGFVIKTRNKYYLNPSQSLNDETFLGVPLYSNQKEILHAIVTQIKKVKPNYSKTFLQKAIIEVAKKANIKILPYGWYLYGECSVLKNQNFESNYRGTLNYSKQVAQTIQEFEQYSNTSALLEYLYTKENNLLYLSRLHLNNLFKEKFTQGSLNSMNIHMRTIMLKYDSSDADLKDVVEFFYSIFGQLFKKNLDDLESIRLEIYTAFHAIWELIGTHEFYKSLQPSYDVDIGPYYKLRFNSLKEVALEHLYKLQEECPPLKQGSDTLKKFKGIQAK